MNQIDRIVDRPNSYTFLSSVALLLVALVLAACAPMRQTSATREPPSPSHELTESISEFEPSQAPEPSSTPSPTILPSPTADRLDPAGPWLVGSSRQGWQAYNLDGSGKTVFRSQSIIGDLSTVSGYLTAIAVNEPLSQQYLEVYRLPSEEPIRSIPLFSESLVAEFEAAEIPFSDRRPETRRLWDVFLAPAKLGLLAWSPDGTRLAFSAALDGPSSDIYLYDPIRDEIVRLTSGLRQAIGSWPVSAWSPDGQWIVHEEAEDFHLAHGVRRTDIAIWAVAADGSRTIRLPISATKAPVAWRDSQTLLFSDFDYVVANIDLEAVNLLTGDSELIFRGQWASLATDSVSGAILFSPCTNLPFERGLQPETFLAVRNLQETDCRGNEISLSPGLYILPADSSQVQKVNTGFSSTHRQVSWLAELGQFAAVFNDYEGQATFLIDPSGQVTQRIDSSCLPEVSPDGRQLAFPCDGLHLYRADGKYVTQLEDKIVGQPTWSPDSSAIYYLAGKDENPYSGSLYMVSIESGRRFLIDPNAELDWVEVVDPSQADAE